jgi:hypothetical protein
VTRVLLLALLAWPAAAKPPEPKIDYSVAQASVQDAVREIAARAGLRYDREKSFAQTDPECRLIVRDVRLRRVPFAKAMQQVLDPAGLRYEVDNGAVVLYRSAAGPLITYSSGKKSVQYIALDIAARIGLGYDFDRSLAQADPQCRIFREVSFKRKPFDAAMAKVLGPVRLRYAVEGGKVVLYRR